jgi:hypothetical protein
MTGAYWILPTGSRTTAPSRPITGFDVGYTHALPFF